MKRDPLLLKDFESPWNLSDKVSARGSYSPIRFVLRLRPDVHALLEGVSPGEIKADASFLEAQAFSTYLHETVHWWQHVGTTMGLVMSMLLPAHAHINRKRLDKVLARHGAVKSLKQLSAHIAQTDTYGLSNEEDLNYVVVASHVIMSPFGAGHCSLQGT